MAGRLQREIKQTKPFQSLEAEAFLALQRTADQLMLSVSALLKPYDISPTQYNVLRILRGAGDAGLPCGEVASRMITRDPDMTRLLDRMETRSFVSRARDTRDRRVVVARITGEGLTLLARIDGPIGRIDKSALGHLGERRLRQLLATLEAIRMHELGHESE